MRDPDRIELFLKTFGDLWKKNPDMRFGQLVMNLSREDMGFADTWEWEDDVWYERMESFPPEPSPGLVQMQDALVRMLLNQLYDEKGVEEWLVRADEQGWDNEERMRQIEQMVLGDKGEEA